jgi:hypothetical protein
MVHAPESDTAVDNVGEVNDEVVALEREMEQERLRAEARVRQLAELKAKKVKEAVEKAEREHKAREEAERAEQACIAKEQAEQAERARQAMEETAQIVREQEKAKPKPKPPKKVSHGDRSIIKST